MTEQGPRNIQLLKALILKRVADLSSELSSPADFSGEDFPEEKPRRPIIDALRGLGEEFTTPIDLATKKQKKKHPFIAGFSAGRNESLSGLGHAMSSKVGKTIMDIFEGK